MKITGKDFRQTEVAQLLASRVQPPKTSAVTDSAAGKASDIKGLNGPHTADMRKSQETEASTQFEALLLHQMLKSMWSTVPGDGMLSGSKEEQYFRDMFTEGLADTIAKGQGIGIKEIVAREIYKADEGAQKGAPQARKTLGFKQGNS